MQKTDKLYPYIKNKVPLSKEEIKNIRGNVSAMFIYKVSGTILNNTDNILISIIVGTIWVGYYSNYFMVMSAILSMGSLLFSSLTASVGNLNTTTDTAKKEKIFNELNLIAYLLFGIFTIGMGNLFNDFITLWIGKEYLLDLISVISIAINFYIQGVLNPIWIFRDTTGLFKDTKWVSIILAVMNLVLSVVLGKIIGLPGILLATAISRLLTSYWYQPYMLYKNIFKLSSKPYFMKQLKYVGTVVATYIIVFFVLKLLPQISIPMFILKGIIVVALSTIILGIVIIKDEETKELYDKYFKKIIKKISAKFNKKQILQK